MTEKMRSLIQNCIYVGATNTELGDNFRLEYWNVVVPTACYSPPVAYIKSGTS